MEQVTKISPAQYELLNMLSNVTRDEDIAELKRLLVKFLNDCLQKEIDRLWDDGVINEKTIEEWGKEHMRTPYNQVL